MTPIRVSETRGVASMITDELLSGRFGGGREVEVCADQVVEIVREDVGHVRAGHPRVTLFVAANFQYSPASMGFFSLVMPSGRGSGWGAALGWNIVPAGIGNMVGGAFLAALPFS